MKHINNEPPEMWKQAARNSDPANSHAAEARINREGTRESATERAVGVVRTDPGLTSAEYEDRYGDGTGKIRKRLNDGMIRGLIVKGTSRACSVTGYVACTWWPVNGHAGGSAVPAGALTPAPSLGASNG